MKYKEAKVDVFLTGVECPARTRDQDHHHGSGLRLVESLKPTGTPESLQEQRGKCSLFQSLMN